MRAAVDCQPGQSHSVGHGKRVRGGDTCRGSARLTANPESNVARGKTSRGAEADDAEPSTGGAVRPDEHVTALRDVFGRLLTQESVLRAIAEEITDVDIFYEIGAELASRHSLVGRWAPNLILYINHGTTHVAELMRAGKGVFVDLGEPSTLRDVVSKWANRIEITSARCYERPGSLEAMLVRPDGYVAWARRSEDSASESERSLCDALEKWFGAANSS
jgi:hypothetical protein